MLNKIAPDKWKHFFAGIVMGLVLQFFLGWLLPAYLLWATSITLLLVIIISYGFELYSKFTGHGHYDIMDAIASIIGGVLGITPIFIFQFTHQ